MIAAIQKVLVYVLLIGSGLGLYYIAAQYTYSVRGYQAVGGEVACLMFPVLCKLLFTSIRDLLHDVKYLKALFGQASEDVK